jgi:adenylosuccinate lyase
MENILMESVKRGADRQLVHEKLRSIALKENSLVEMVAAMEKEKIIHLSRQEIEKIADPKHLVGRAPLQVVEFLQSEVNPFLEKYPPQNISIPLVEL